MSGQGGEGVDARGQARSRWQEGPLPIIARERLLQELRGVLTRKLAVICAPAGYGKTTLVRDLQHSLGIPFIWFALGPAHGQLAGFLRGLAAAAAPHVPGGIRLALPLSRLPEADVELRELGRLLAADLADGPEEHLVLVLDDLHVADAVPEIWPVLEGMLADLPAGVHLVIASRTRPRLPLARLEALGLMLRLEAADLSFSSAEARHLLREVLSAEPGEEELALALQRTEGWAAGLVLVANALRDRAPGERLGLLRQFRGHGQLFDFVAQEVMAAQPPDLQDFLLKSSVLTALEPGLLHDLLPGAPIGPMLQRLEERNLFLVPQRAGGAAGAPPESYRYHHLFRGFLQQQSIRHLGDAALQDLHRRAARAYLDRRREEEALSHLVAAREWSAAAPIMAGLVDDYLKALRQEDVSGWLRQAPRELLDNDPDLVYVRAQLEGWLPRYEVLAGLYERCLNLYEARGDRRGLLRTLNWMQHRFWALRRPIVQAAAARFAGHGDPELAARGQVLLASCMVAEGRWDDAIAALEELLPATPAGGQERWLCQGTLAAVAFWAADFPRCLQHGVEESLSRTAAGDFTWDVYNWAAYGLLGDGVGMELFQKQFVSQDLPPAMRRMAANVAQFGQAMIYVFRREWAAAMACLEGLRPYFNDRRSLFPSLGSKATFTAQAELARLYQRIGRHTEAREYLERNLELAMGHTELGVLAAAQMAEHMALGGQLPAARSYLQKARELQPAGVVGLTGLVTGVAAARTLWADGDHAGATAAAADVLRATMERRCPYLVVHYGGEPLVPVLAELARGPGRDLVTSWLRSIWEEMSGFLGGLTTHPDPDLRRGADSLLDLLGPGARGRPSPDLRVYALGRTEAYVHNRLVGGNDWNRAKVKLLFMALLLRRGRPLAKEEILAWLWPRAPGATARANLRVTVHGLKRALEPGLPAGAASRFIDADRESVTLIQPERIWCDVWEFEDKLNRGRQLMRRDDREEGAENLRAAVALWRGTLLPGNTFAEQFVDVRSRLEQGYIRACLDLSEHAVADADARGAVEYARRALTADPAAEAAYQFLIRAYLHLGDRESAMNAYRVCRKRLRVHLGVDPSPETLALLQQ